MWPITKESIQQMSDNTYLYTRKIPNKNWVEEDIEEEREDNFIQLSLEEYDALDINDKHVYLKNLGDYLDFDPNLVKPSQYSRMTQKEKEEYETEMRWMASEEFQVYLKYFSLDDEEVKALSPEDKITYFKVMNEYNNDNAVESEE